MSYAHVLSARYVPLLLSGTLLGRLPNGMCMLAIPLAMRDAGVSFGFIGLVVGGYLTASAAVAPVLGRLVDRYGPVWVLLISTAVGASALAVLAAGPDRGAVTLVAALVAGLGTPPLEPTLRALWPRLVQPRVLQHAYGVDASSQTLIFVAGPLLVSAAALAASPTAAVLLTAVLMVAGVLLVVSSPMIRARREPIWSGPKPDPLFGRTYGTLILGLAGAGGSMGALNVYAVDYVQQCTVPGGVGAIPAAASVAGLVCGLIVGALRWRTGRVRVLAAAHAVATAALIAVPPCSPTVLLGAAAVGLFLPPLLGAAFGLVNRVVPAGRSAEALAWLTTLFIAGSALATVLSGSAVEAAGSAGAAAVGTVLAACGALVCLSLRSADR